MTFSSREVNDALQLRSNVRCLQPKLYPPDTNIMRSPIRHQRRHGCHGYHGFHHPSPWLPDTPNVGVLLRVALLCCVLIRTGITSSGMGCPSECRCPNSTSQVICESAGLSDIPRGLPPVMTTLDMSDNNLHSLSPGDLSSLRTLVNLKLKNNDIDTIHDGSFEALVSLQTLDLGQNKLRSIQERTFQGADSLLHLDLSHNALETIDGAFAGKTELSRLDLASNKIKRITQFTFRDLTNLRYLLLAGNQIDHIERKAFRNLEKLMYLVLKGNPIGNVPRFQFNSYFLSYVDLSECGLQQVPRGLPNSIRYLQLRRNNMTVVGRHTFKDCPYVSILVLDENGIETIEEHTFEHMTYLHQLWLNSNKLSSIPHPLPNTLQRLLMDSNHVTEILDSFPSRSQIHTLSFMGNNITRISATAFTKLRNLRSVDFSNNQIEHIYSDTFSRNSKLETLQLSKNPLRYLHGASLHGLRSLKTLSLAYILTDVAVHPDAFRDLTRVRKLDLDSSPTLIRVVFSVDSLLDPLAGVEDLSMQSSDLTHIPPAFPEFFPHLGVFHISSSRWHCDTSMLWFKNWLVSTPVRIENKEDIRCFTPRKLHDRPIVTLSDYDFVLATTPKPTTPYAWKFTTHTPTEVKFSTAWWGQEDGSGYRGDVDDEESSEDGDGIQDYEDNHEVIDPDIPDLPDDLDLFGVGDRTGTPSPNGSKLPTWAEIWGQSRHRPSTASGAGGAVVGAGSPKTTTTSSGIKYVEGAHNNIMVPANGTRTTVHPQGESQGDEENNGDEDHGTVIIVVATTLATVVIAAILIATIVYLTRKQRKKKKVPTATLR